MTPEQRLSRVEQTTTTLQHNVSALSRDIREINQNESMLLGMTMKLQEHTREMRVDLASLSERLDGFQQEVYSRFETIDKRFDAIDNRFETVDRRFDAIDNRFETQQRIIESFERGVNDRLDQILLMLSTLTSKPNQEGQ